MMKSAPENCTKVQSTSKHRSADGRQVTLGKYKDSRYWAIWINGELLVVTVYKKGANAVLECLGLEAPAIELPKSRKPKSRFDELLR
jgi:hypothetical protein